ncbi:MAG: zinc-ribbon domain-containing protein, partial [Myxococcota bacterium]
MEITCPRCQSLHEIEPPVSARARPARSLKFRCSHCGHTFAVDAVTPAPEDAGPPPLDAAPDAEPIRLVQVAGKTWAVPDLAALHRWVLERRIDRESLVSHHGLRWTRAGEREDLAVFFSAADALSFQERNLRTEIPGPPDEEIIVDAGEADEPAMPVSVGPDPFGRRMDVDPLVMDFNETREDTAEQTVHSMGVDEAPIPAVPAGFDRVDVADRTERLPPRPPAPPEFPAGL